MNYPERIIDYVLSLERNLNLIGQTDASVRRARRLGRPRGDQAARLAG